MAHLNASSCPRCFGLGVTAGLTAAAGLLLGRKAAAAQAQVGHGHSLKHRALDLASGVMQQKYPLDAMSTQVEAHHFCIHLAHDMHQCVIFDSTKPDARLIGIEYIISEERFRRLPDEERQLWHSHHYEVKSGELVAPGIPELAERAYFADLVSTYGKTFHTWQVDRDDFPYGIPQLMMGFTSDGQSSTPMVDARDRRLGISTKRRREDRAHIPMPTLVPGANAWEGGRTLQTRLEEMDLKR